MSRRRLALLALIVLAFRPGLVRADFYSVDYPGARATWLGGYDGTTVVGTYDSGTATHGFTYNGTTYTSFDVPGSVFTSLRGVSGTNIVGVMSGATSFLYDGATITPITVPGATSVYVAGVSGNNVAGIYWDASGQHAFVKNGATVTTLANLPASSGPQVNGIYGNAAVGSYAVGTTYVPNVGYVSNENGFITDGTTLKSVIYPGSSITRFIGTNGTIAVGHALDSTGDHSFVYDGSIFTPFNLPNANSFYINGISGNTVYGTYFDANGEHGFLQTINSSPMTATPEPTSLALALGGALGLAGYARCRRWT